MSTIASGIERRSLVGFLVALLVHGLLLGALMRSGRNVAARDVEVRLAAAAPVAPRQRRNRHRRSRRRRNQRRKKRLR